MKRILVFFTALFACSCATTEYAGNSSSGYREFPGYRISPGKAVELAGDYLDITCELRLKNRKSNFKGPLQITVVLRGDWYYVSMDNYPYKTIEAYRYHAVRVHVMTGEVEEPE